MSEALKKFEVCGLKAKYFFPLLIIAVVAMYLGWLPKDFSGTLGLLFLVGGLLFWLGKTIPIVNTYFGGACLLPIFVGAALNYWGLIPEGVFGQIQTWLQNWQNLFVGAILIGSIMMIDRRVLLKSITKFIPAILGGHLLALILVGLGALVTGMDLGEAICYVAVPCLSGGVAGPSAVLGPMYSEIAGEDLTSLAGLMVCYDNIANVLAIVGSALLAKICMKKAGWSGDGYLLIGQEKFETGESRPNSSANYNRLGTGAALCCTIMIAGTIVGKVLPQIHSIAWAIVIAIIIKCLGWFGDEETDACIYWNQFMGKVFLAPLVFAIGIVYLDFGALIEYFTPLALLMIVLTIIGATVGSMVVGRLVGLFPLEIGLSAGLCSCNSGGSGDIACLSAADRMGLLPFASIATRIGGGLMLIWGSLLFPLLMK